ncbi:hypothetical protein I6F33_09040 [Bradyrhizobium sp. BRP20]|uniref:hypothetical protein n=1 Tax=Bradyrhizobium sp. BRP20 TaxID=2793822 RepID=UPI001CD3FE38|nr:hypothetical protein [Bradyrhizobium sp. BRP20]MCA1433117.1 hypothetical protein [Bradyrhizobium sp. BRP20]
MGAFAFWGVVTVVTSFDPIGWRNENTKKRKAKGREKGGLEKDEVFRVKSGHRSCGGVAVLSGAALRRTVEAVRTMTDDVGSARKRAQRVRKQQQRRERMRRYRANVREQVSMVLVPVSNKWIDDFIDAQRLLASESEDKREIATAITEIVSEYLASAKKKRSS